MSGFTNAEGWCIRVGNSYVSTAGLSWEVGFVGSGLICTVPAGTVFDVSIPRYLMWVFDPHDTRYLKAAALHDHTLRVGWDRVSAAALFNDALKASNVNSAERFTMTLGVIVYKWK